MTVSLRRPLAAAGLVLAAAGATLVGAPPAVAATPDQVALVVQYPNGQVGTSCVTYRGGMTGADVLAGANPVYGTGPYAGFVLTIGGQGNSRTKPPSDSTYWAYWRSTGGTSYSYSGSGVTSTQPAAGSVEAWIWYEDGEPSFPRQSYAQLCPNGYTADAAPSAAAPKPAPPAATGRAASTPASPDGSGTATTTSPDDPSATPTTSGPAASTTSTPSTSTAPSTGSSARATTSVAASEVAATRDTSGSGTGPLVGLVVAVLAVLGLGVAAVVTRRRRAEGD